MTIAAHSMLAAMATMLCCVPLFNVLGYEFSEVIMLVAMPWAMAMGATTLQRGGSTQNAFLKSTALLVLPLLASHSLSRYVSVS